MILKIQTVWDKEYYWKLIDNVSEVNSRPINKEARQDKRCNPNMYIQAINREGKIDESNECYKWVWCIKDSELYNICTNCLIYIIHYP